MTMNRSKTIHRWKIKLRLRFGPWRLVKDDKHHMHYERRWPTLPRVLRPRRWHLAWMMFRHGFDPMDSANWPEPETNVLGPE